MTIKIKAKIIKLQNNNSKMINRNDDDGTAPQRSQRDEIREEDYDPSSLEESKERAEP